MSNQVSMRKLSLFVSRLVAMGLIVLLTETVMECQDAFLTFPVSDNSVNLYHGWDYQKGQYHGAVDILQPTGNDVVAAADGVAILSCQPPLAVSNPASLQYGNFVMVVHANGYSTLYAHLDSISLPAESQLPCDTASRFAIKSTADFSYGGHSYKWSSVLRGQKLGTVGTTGTVYSHLHFEVSVNAQGSYESAISHRIDPYSIYSVASDYPPPQQKCGSAKGASPYLWIGCPPQSASDLSTPPPVPEYLYVGNQDGTISGLSISPLTGDLVPVAGSPFGSGPTVTSLALDPTDQFLVAGTEGDATPLYFYKLNSSTGVPQLVQSIDIGEQTFPVYVAVDQSAKFVFVNWAGLSSGLILGLSFASQPVSIASVVGGGGDGVIIDPLNRFAFAVGRSPSGLFAQPGEFVSSYNLNPALGSLSLSSSTPADDTHSTSPVVHPSGRFLYTVNATNDSISGYFIDPSSGALTKLIGSPFISGSHPVCAAIAPNGRYAFVSSSDNTVREYLINQADGTLSAMTSYQTGSTSLGCLAVESSGNFLYVLAPNSESIIGFRIDSVTGVLTPLPHSPFIGTGLLPASLAVTHSHS